MSTTKKFNKIVDSAIDELKSLRQQAAKDVQDKHLESIVEYFGNNAGLEKVVRAFGVDYSTLSADDTNGLLCILYDANKQWNEAPCDEDGPTREQNEILDNILLETACDIICYFRA
jgi:hypothetical protein